MKIISKEALIATMLAALAAPVIAEEEACTLVSKLVELLSVKTNPFDNNIHFLTFFALQ